MFEAIDPRKVNPGFTSRPSIKSLKAKEEKTAADFNKELFTKSCKNSNHHIPKKIKIGSKIPLSRAAEAKPEKKIVNPAQILKVDIVREKYGFTGRGVSVAVLDSGINHPEKPLKAWQDMVDDTPAWRGLLDESSIPIDPWGHGTHVAGNVNQMAPEADMVGIRVMDKTGATNHSRIVKGIQWAIENKDKYNIKIINISLGDLPNPYGIPGPVEGAAYDAVKAGIVVVSSAGNEGPTPGSISLPANKEEVIAVGSTLDSEHLAPSSSRGPANGWLGKPDVLAPGDLIKSWASPDSEMVKIAVESAKIRALSGKELGRRIAKKPDLIATLGLPKNFAELSSREKEAVVKKTLPQIYLTPDQGLIMSGTSFAAPEVAGVIALMFEANDDLSPKQVQQIIRETSRPLNDPSLGPNDQGKGLVDALAAVEAALELKKSKGA